MTENFRPTVLRNRACAALKGKWGNAVVATLIFLVVAGVYMALGGSPMDTTPHPMRTLVQLLFCIFVYAFVGAGFYFVFLDVARGKKVNLATMFEAFKSYGRYLKGILLVFIYTILWTFLFIIPGIIKSISYSQTYFIMRDNPEMGAGEAINRSMEMMKGHKMEYFLLGLSFIGWLLLCIPTAGIGLLWVIPYMQTAVGEFYKSLKGE